MQAILFPLTYIPASVCEAVGTYFQPVRIYQPTRRRIPAPLQAFSRKGLIDIAIPAEDDDDKIEILVRDYRNWAELHQGGGPDYLKRRQGSVPFFDDTATTRIKAEIQQTARAPEADDPLFNARMFLQFAQEYDLQSEEITRKLVATDRAERKLFKNITGAPEVLTPNDRWLQIQAGIDAAGYMIPARVRAWARLFIHAAASDPMGAAAIFVTLRREGFEFLMERAPAAECMLKLAALPVIDPLAQGFDDWRGRFDRIMASLPENADAAAADLVAGFQGNDPSGPKVDLTIYRIPGEAPSVFFGRCIDPLARDAGRGLPGEPEFTLIGLVELNRLKAEGE